MPFPSSATASACARSERGFTLLEVMCAFVILATLISFIVETWFESMQNASRSADSREIREVSDTVFGRILFEHQVGKFHDGDGGTLDVLYGTWARLSSRDRERYERYEWRLEIKKVQAAGQGEDSSDTESLTGGPSSSSDGGSGSGSSSGSPGSSDSETEKSEGGVLLERITLRIRYQPEYATAEERDADLIVLSRLMPQPPDLTGTGSGN